MRVVGAVIEGYRHSGFASLITSFGCLSFCVVCLTMVSSVVLCSVVFVADNEILEKFQDGFCHFQQGVLKPSGNRDGFPAMMLCPAETVTGFRHVVWQFHNKLCMILTSTCS